MSIGDIAYAKAKEAITQSEQIAQELEDLQNSGVASTVARLQVGANVIYPTRMGRVGGRINIQFDDGYLDNYQYAKPILDKYGFKATLFMIGNKIGYNGGSPLSTYLTASQLVELEESGWEIGSHSQTHPNMKNLTVPQLHDEFALSKAAILAAGVKSVTSFAYPFGTVASSQLTHEIGSIYYDRLRITDYNGSFGFSERGGIIPGAFANASTNQRHIDELKQLCLSAVTNQWDISIYIHHVYDHADWLSPALFEQLIDYIYNIGGKTANLREIMVPYNQLVFTDTEFNSLSNWNVGGSAITSGKGIVTIDGAESYSPPSSLKITGIVGIGSQNLTVRPEVGFGGIRAMSGVPMRVSMRYKTLNVSREYTGGDSGITIGLQGYTRTGSAAGDAWTRSTVATTNGWEVLSVSFTPRTDTDYLMPYIRMAGCVGEIWCDHIIVTYPEWGSIM